MSQESPSRNFGKKAYDGALSLGAGATTGLLSLFAARVVTAGIADGSLQAAKAAILDIPALSWAGLAGGSVTSNAIAQHNNPSKALFGAGYVASIAGAFALFSGTSLTTLPSTVSEFFVPTRAAVQEKSSNDHHINTTVNNPNVLSDGTVYKRNGYTVPSPK